MALNSPSVLAPALVVGLLTCAVALAGGGPTASTGQADRVIGQATYRCKGGVTVHITQMTSSARVDFAGQTQTLELTPEASGVAYQNSDFSWFSKGRASYMKNINTGSLVLTDCVPVKS
jgi:membrane-bound inhibitor of C-type lysozyme